MTQTTFSIHPLLELKDLFQTFADIALDAVEKPIDETLVQLQTFATRGMDCVVARKGEDVIGYTLFGPTEKFFSWSTQMPLLFHLRKEGIKELYTACHVHLKKEYWKTGTQLAMSRAFCSEILNRGVIYLLLWGYATDQLATYSLSRPGSTELEGFVDTNGRKVGVRDLRVYLHETEPSE